MVRLYVNFGIRKGKLFAHVAEKDCLTQAAALYAAGAAYVAVDDWAAGHYGKDEARELRRAARKVALASPRYY